MCSLRLRTLMGVFSYTSHLFDTFNVPICNLKLFICAYGFQMFHICHTVLKLLMFILTKTLFAYVAHVSLMCFLDVFSLRLLLLLLLPQLPQISDHLCKHTLNHKNSKKKTYYYCDSLAAQKMYHRHNNKTFSSHNSSPSVVRVCPSSSWSREYKHIQNAAPPKRDGDHRTYVELLSF